MADEEIVFRDIDIDDHYLPKDVIITVGHEDFKNGIWHGLFNLSVTKMFTYENVIEENLGENIKEKETIKNKTETEKLIFNGIKYNFKKDETLRFLKW